jgi:hypothetical protein
MRLDFILRHFVDVLKIDLSVMLRVLKANGINMRRSWDFIQMNYFAGDGVRGRCSGFEYF